MKIDLQVGDVFCSANPQSKLLGAGINFFQKLHSKDNESKYGHAGIICNSEGKTVEALLTIKYQNIYIDYTGQDIIVARPIADLDGNPISTETKQKVLDELIEEQLGRIYPGWRLFLHIVPVLAKYIHFVGKPVCSEFTAKDLAKAKARYAHYWGVNPDTLADEWVRWKNFEVVFEGKVD